MSEKEEQLRVQYSENQKITGGNYDKSLAVVSPNSRNPLTRYRYSSRSALFCHFT